MKDPMAPTPFVGGFGNRATDVATYRAVGIPDSHIFIINPKGELSIPTGVNMPTGYQELIELVDYVFPPSQRICSESHAFSNFPFWRDDVPSDFEPLAQKSQFA